MGDRDQSQAYSGRELELIGWAIAGLSIFWTGWTLVDLLAWHRVAGSTAGSILVALIGTIGIAVGGILIRAGRRWRR